MSQRTFWRSFDYSLKRSSLNLQRSTAELDRLPDLQSRIEESLPYISLTSEAAQRELLIAPILLDVVHYTQAQLRIEYPLNVTDQLKGSLDYYLHSARKLLVVEAKNADLARGFTQIAVELIALNAWSDSDQPMLQGAVSTGNIWQFGLLDREPRQIIQDLNLYRVPADLEYLLRILVASLEPSNINLSSNFLTSSIRPNAVSSPIFVVFTPSTKVSFAVTTVVPPLSTKSLSCPIICSSSLAVFIRSPNTASWLC